MIFKRCLATVSLVLLMLVMLAGGCGRRGGQQTAFDVSPDGKQIIFSGEGNGGSDLYLLNLDSQAVTRVTNSSDMEITPAFAPDGKQIVYAAASASDQPAHVFVRALNGAQGQQLTTGMPYARYPSFSPDGSQIVFARALRHRPYSMGGWTWDHWDVFVMKADGTGLRRITNRKYYQVYAPEFLPDGKSVVFAADPAGEVEEAVYRTAKGGTQEPKRLTQQGGYDSSVSPDGKRVVFISDWEKSFDYELWLMNADGTNQTQLTRNKSYNQNPRFKPDGKHILFLSDPSRGGEYSLWQVSTNGKELRQIADSSLFKNPLGWKPHH